MYGRHYTEEVKQKLREILKGEKSCKSYSIERYETHTSRRDKFKRAWNFEDFEEIESDEAYIYI